MKSNGKKIYWLSDSPFSNTGFSSQSLFLLNKLADKGYEIHYQAHNYMGQDLPKGCVKLADGTPFNFYLYGNGREPYSKDLIIPRLRELKPDYFCVLLDTFMLFPWYLQQDFAPSKTLFWFPSDGGGRMPMNCEQVLQKCHYPIAMAKYGQKQCKDVHGIETGYIPHAVNPDMFKPVPKEDKEKLKEKYGLGGKFVVGLVGRNQGRKMHDRTIKAFAIWCKKHQDAVLFIHADPQDGAAVFDMMALIQQLGIQNRVLFSGMKFFRGLTYEQMNEIYNIMDVYVSSTSGEGFGVCTIEAMSCGIPILNTAYTTTDELVVEHNAGEAIKLAGCDYKNVMETNVKDYDIGMMNGTITGSWSVERGIVDIHDFSKKLEKMYNDPKLREEYGRNGRLAVLENYTWDIIADKWDEALKKV